MPPVVCSPETSAWAITVCYSLCGEACHPHHESPCPAVPPAATQPALPTGCYEAGPSQSHLQSLRHAGQQDHA